MDFLNAAEMEITRSPKQLSDWVSAQIENMGSTPEGREYSRSDDRLSKKFWEEIRPLSIYLEHEYGATAGVKCTPHLGSQSFDARIANPDGTSTHVEITVSKDGYDERLRLDELNKTGSVNMLGTISVTGTKSAGTRRVEIENEMVNHDHT